MPKLSLKKILARYTMTVFAIVFLLTCLSYVVMEDYLSQRFHAQALQNVSAKIENISHLVAFYQSIISKLSHQTDVAKLLLFSDAQPSQAWAQHNRQLIPDTTGLALVDLDGVVKGDPPALSLGKRCLEDIKKRIHGLPVPEYPVHKQDAGLDHFDVMVNVKKQDETIGVVFASFSLKLLQQQLENLISDGQKFTLRSANKQVIAQVDRLAPEERPGEKITLGVPGTDWTLEAEVAELNLSPVLITEGWISFSMFILLALVLYIMASRLLHIFEADFNSIHHLLKNVGGSREGQGEIQSRLAETHDVMNGIQAIARDISHYQQQLVNFSITDELTGLYNRRAFQQETERCFHLAQRGMSIHMVLIDLDNFKQANDVLGHVAGDRLLRMLANCLREHSRDTDICARLGGDEFVLVLMNSDNLDLQDWYKNLAQDFRSAQQEQLELPRHTHVSSISAGATTILETDENIEQVVERADRLLYAAKEQGRGNLQLDEGN